jgi:hypothetical protein
MNSCFRHAVSAFLPLALWFPCGWAQTIHLKGKQYVESFVGKPRVSGNLLVGLRFGEPAGNFDPTAVGLYVTPAVVGRSACVDISSRDGRYYAQNAYLMPSASGIFLPFEVDSKYLDQLSHYDLKDIAVTVRLVGDCNAPEEGELVPAVASTQSSPPASSPRNRSLVAFVNAEPDRLKVVLLRKGLEASAAECRSDPTAVQIAFTSSCEFRGNGALAAGSYDLLIRVRERFAWRDSHFSVQLP